MWPTLMVSLKPFWQLVSLNQNKVCEFYFGSNFFAVTFFFLTACCPLPQGFYNHIFTTS